MSSDFAGQDERRSQPRIVRVHKIFLQVVDDQAADEEPRLLRCTCENLSPTGLAINLVESVPEDARVQLWINVEDCDERFLLAGTVRWSRPAAHQLLHEIGVELQDDPSGELERWAALWAEHGTPGLQAR